jgi:phenylacetate-coenzyme A ligase PaaK-like adenylate-forming protein
LRPDTDRIFNIKNIGEFTEIALSVFNHQATETPIYNKYINLLKVDIDSVKSLTDIPFLPVEFFKTQKVAINAKAPTPNARLFTSSGTTGSITSKHYVNDVSIYEQSYIKGFQHFYGNIKDYCILALLPSYLERDGSSLIYMANDLINKSKHPKSGFYLNNYNELLTTLKHLEAEKQKTILLGVSYALLDLAELMDTSGSEKFGFKNTIVMETGGMKGKRREMLKEELHSTLCHSFGVDLIHSEYGMTELLSQAYSKGNGIYYCPPWMKVLIRDVNDPFSFLSSERTGGINIIDLANINSCSFIATQDLGQLYTNDSFRILGRFDNSDIRGCNLLVD